MRMELVERPPFMDSEKTTRAEPVTLGSLEKAREQLQGAIDNLSELIEKMGRAKIDTVPLRWKTRRESARDWFLFSKDLDRAFEKQILANEAEQEGQSARDRARKFRDK
jgi:hypothetical protein